MTKNLNSAHQTALDLLKIVDSYCVKEGLIYTLSMDNLISLGKLDFSECAPIISIAMEYDNFKRVEEYLKEYCDETIGYSLHNYENTEQFNTADMWFVKHSRVKLSEPRADEEFYYGTRLVITPLFYAGDTKREWKRAYKRFSNCILPLYFRAMLKKKPVSTWIKLTPRRIRTAHFLKQRGKISLNQVLTELKSTPKSEYILFPVMSTKGNGINIMPDTISRESVKLTYSSFWSKVERIDYFGVECYSLADKERLVSLFPASMRERALHPRKSQLLLNGGEELRRIQLIQIELLTEFDRICRKHGLKYNINFGTLIGALRHKGFIPWDDDIDVTMYYEDCDKLEEIMEKELDKDKYFYRCPSTEPNHHLIFNHLERRGTTFTKPGRDKLKNEIGVFIDIFPMYPAAPNVFIDFFHTKICRFWRTALWSTVGADSEKNPVKRFYYRKIAKIGNHKCREKFLKYATFFKNSKGRLKFWTSIDRSPYNVDLVRKDNFTDAVELEFEGRQFYAPAYYEGTLEFCFSSDWRLYPNTDERIPTHDAIIEIANLYDYKENEIS